MNRALWHSMLCQEPSVECPCDNDEEVAEQIFNIMNCALQRRSRLFQEQCWIITKKKQSKLESRRHSSSL